LTAELSGVTRTDRTDVEAVNRARVMNELRELIDALDRRVPQVHRVGEVAIAKAALALRDEAMQRLDELGRETPLNEQSGPKG
jgi:hypothetical protein